jgi:hypothetical protein
MSDPIIHQVTPNEAARLDAVAAEEESRKEELVARLARQDLASNERSLVGQIRRAVADSLIGPEKLAADIGVDVAAFVGFQAGDCELPVEALDKLFRRLSLVLVTKPGC